MIMPGRVLAVLLLATLAGSAGCCSGAVRFRSPRCLEGSWELVSATYLTPDGRLTAPEPALRSLKVLSRGHFAYITVREDGSFVHSSGGEYKVRGNRYVEHVLYSSVATLRGHDFPFTWRLDRDLWFHTRGVDSLRVEEVWRRARRNRRTRHRLVERDDVNGIQQPATAKRR